MSDEKRDFKFEEEDYVVVRPSMVVLDEASKVYNKTFSQAINSGAIIRERLDDVLREQGLWNDAKQMKYQTLRREVLDMELKLKRGGIRLQEGRKIAMDIKTKRDEMVDMLLSRNNLDSHTAEGQADNMRFNYLVSACLVYKKTNKPYFKSLEDYLNNANEPLSVQAARELYALLYRSDESVEESLAENRFLKRFNFVDEKLRLIDENGHLVDGEGRLIDETGRFVDKDGNFIDIDGNPVDEEGEYLVDEQPFLDDNDQPIVEKKKDSEEKSSRKKTQTTTS
jgi:hypothetical protein